MKTRNALTIAALSLSTLVAGSALAEGLPADSLLNVDNNDAQLAVAPEAGPGNLTGAELDFYWIGDDHDVALETNVMADAANRTDRELHALLEVDAKLK